MPAFATAIIGSAFLLFVVQPLTARRLLPSFGGSAAVWTVSLLFFQCILLAGYSYAYLLTRFLSSRRQAVIHSALVIIGMLFLPLGPDEPTTTIVQQPFQTIFQLLATNLGLPLLVISATNPLMQRWIVSTLQDRVRVYRLFALSNLGSLLGLLCYPFLIEPAITLKEQVWFWSIGYGVFTAATGLCAIEAYRRASIPIVTKTIRNNWQTLSLWISLSATGSALLMATTNQLTQNVASVPFLWTIPLSLYLLSFIIVFERQQWYSPPFWSTLFIISLLAVFHLLGASTEPDFIVQMFIYCLNLFSGCMICHGELARRKPLTQHLTSFYMYIAVGGVLGGVLVSIIAPQLFSGYWEYPLSLLTVYLIGGSGLVLRNRNRIIWAVGGLAITVFVLSYLNLSTVGTVTMRRNFYGVLKVSDRFPQTENWERYLWNGPIAHGGQLLFPSRRKAPMLYYGSETGVALALAHDSTRPKRIGVIGLGTGSLSLFGRKHDNYYFFELNPHVIDIANDFFYYLRDTAATVEINIGDGRLLLEKEKALDLDVLVIDAFTGDAIPVHLLTAEAFAIYKRHLAPNGILAIHISNLHFDLEPVVRAQATEMGLISVLVQSNANESQHLYVADWMLVTDNIDFLSDPKQQQYWAPRTKGLDENSLDYLWTDNFSNLFSTLR